MRTATIIKVMMIILETIGMTFRGIREIINSDMLIQGVIREATEKDTTKSKIASKTKTKAKEETK
jgi:hypothetical protein